MKSDKLKYFNGFFVVLILTQQVYNAIGSTYRMEYAVKAASHIKKIYLPIPSYWDGSAVKNLSIVQISPNPTEYYRDKNGTEIAYWESLLDENQFYKVVFDIELQRVNLLIDENTNWPAYNTNDELYINYTKPTDELQSEHPTIIQLSEQIVGTETNPYLKAKNIYLWICDNIANRPENTPPSPSDALSTIQRGWAYGCGSYSNVFVALCMASGVPARAVAGLHPNYSENPTIFFQEGAYSYTPGGMNDIEAHLWSEFYLPGFGWFQCDMSRKSMSSFGKLGEERVILSKGNEIEIRNSNENGCAENESFIHLPLGDAVDYCTQIVDGHGETWINIVSAQHDPPDITVTDSVEPTTDLFIPFDNITVGGISDQTMTLANDGIMDLDIGNIAQANSLTEPFSILNDTCSQATLSPGASCTFNVRFLPENTGQFSDTFDIPSNDPDEDPAIISLSGSGVESSDGGDDGSDGDLEGDGGGGGSGCFIESLK